MSNARALWRFVIKLPSPVSWRLTFSLLTAYSWLLFALCSYLFLLLIKVSHPSLSTASARSVHVLLSVVHYYGRYCHPLFSESEMVHLYTTEPPCAWGSMMLFSCCSHRIPEESLYQTGIIRQRKSCLESHKSEDQELPILSLNPCNSSKGTVPKAQVRCVVYPRGVGWEEAMGAASRWFLKVAKALL